MIGGSRSASALGKPDNTVRFALKNGTEIHRIGTLAEVYDYNTGKLVGHVGPQDASCGWPLMPR